MREESRREAREDGRDSVAPDEPGSDDRMDDAARRRAQETPPQDGEEYGPVPVEGYTD